MSVCILVTCLYNLGVFICKLVPTSQECCKEINVLIHVRYLDQWLHTISDFLKLASHLSNLSNLCFPCFLTLIQDIIFFWIAVLSANLLASSISPLRSLFYIATRVIFLKFKYYHVTLLVIFKLPIMACYKASLSLTLIFCLFFPFFSFTILKAFQ